MTEPSGRGGAAPKLEAGGRLLVRLEGVGVVLEGREVLQNVYLEVKGGETLALIGPNGGGKTTLIRVLLGLQRINAGSVTWFDEKGSGRPEPCVSAGYVAQRTRADLRFPLTVCEVIGMALRRGRPPWYRMTKEDHRLVHRSLERMGIPHLAERLAGRLSGGQQQRMLVARAIVRRPDLLVLDEPTTGIDERGRDEILTLLAELRAADGVGVVLATHEAEQVADLADRVSYVDGTVTELQGKALRRHGDLLPKPRPGAPHNSGASDFNREGDGPGR